MNIDFDFGCMIYDRFCHFLTFVKSLNVPFKVNSIPELEIASLSKRTIQSLSL